MKRRRRRKYATLAVEAGSNGIPGANLASAESIPSKSHLTHLGPILGPTPKVQCSESLVRCLSFRVSHNSLFPFPCANGTQNCHRPFYPFAFPQRYFAVCTTDSDHRYRLLVTAPPRCFHEVVNEATQEVSKVWPPAVSFPRIVLCAPMHAFDCVARRALCRRRQVAQAR